MFLTAGNSGLRVFPVRRQEGSAHQLAGRADGAGNANDCMALDG